MSQIKSDPIKTLLENKQAVMNAWCQNDGSVKRTWEALSDEIKEAMKFNTFKQYLTAFANVVNAVHSDQAEQECDALAKELEAARDEAARYKRELLVARQELDRTKREVEKANNRIEALEKEMGRLTDEPDALSEDKEMTQGEFRVTADEWGTYRDRLNNLTNEVKQLKAGLNNRDQVAQPIIKPVIEPGIKPEYLEAQEPPANLDGWTIARHGKYFRAFRKINGKVHGVHIGKHFNTAAARRKIADKVASLTG